MQTDSELESDTSSINEGISCGINMATLPMLSKEQLDKRMESVVQENRVLKIEIETFKLRVKTLQEENKELRKASVNIQVRAEQEEEYISNKLLKKIQSLKKEKETLANNYEREEEYLTNDLSRKLHQLRNEKVQLEQTLEQEQEHMVNKLMRKIERLEAETSAKQTNLEQLRREKIELENTLEQEQESLVNRLWKRMERLETEKRILQEKLDQPISAPMSPRQSISSSSGVSTSSLSSSQPGNNNNTNNATGGGSNTLPSTLPMPIGSSEQAATLTEHIINLRREVTRLKTNLEKTERDHKENMAKLVKEEKGIRDENIRLQRRLQMEVDRRETLCRHLSESESSLEMDDERHFNESGRVRTVSSPVPGYLLQATHGHVVVPPNGTMCSQSHTANAATASSSGVSGGASCSAVFPQPISPKATNIPHMERCPACNQIKVSTTQSAFLLSNKLQQQQHISMQTNAACSKSTANNTQK